MVTATLMTAEDLWNLAPDGHTYELIRGMLHQMAAAGGKHGEVSFEFGRRLGNHAIEHGLGLVYSSETGFVLGRAPDIVLAPDVAFVRADRVPPEESSQGFLDLAPDLAFEVLSPSNIAAAIADKVAIYLASGVRVALVADHRRRSFVVHRPGQRPDQLGEGDVLDLTDVIPGFRIPVAEIFARPPLRTGSP